MPDGRAKTSAINGRLYGGRPKGSMNAETKHKRSLQEAFLRKVDEEMDDLNRALFDTARGHVLVAKGADGKPAIYKKSPSVEALKEIYNRALGKPQERIDLTSKGEKITVIAELLDRLEGLEPPDDTREIVE